MRFASNFLSVPIRVYPWLNNLFVFFVVHLRNSHSNSVRITLNSRQMTMGK